MPTCRRTPTTRACTRRSCSTTRATACSASLTQTRRGTALCERVTPTTRRRRRRATRASRSTSIASPRRRRRRPARSRAAPRPTRRRSPPVRARRSPPAPSACGCAPHRDCRRASCRACPRASPTVTATGPQADGYHWVEVAWGSLHGWLASEYLVAATPSAATPPPPAPAAAAAAPTPAATAPPTHNQQPQGPAVAAHPRTGPCSGNTLGAARRITRPGGSGQRSGGAGHVHGGEAATPSPASRSASARRASALAHSSTRSHAANGLRGLDSVLAVGRVIALPSAVGRHAPAPPTPPQSAPAPTATAPPPASRDESLLGRAGRHAVGHRGPLRARGRGVRRIPRCDSFGERPRRIEHHPHRAGRPDPARPAAASQPPPPQPSRPPHPPVRLRPTATPSSPATPCLASPRASTRPVRGFGPFLDAIVRRERPGRIEHPPRGAGHRHPVVTGTRDADTVPAVPAVPGPERSTQRRLADCSAGQTWPTLQICSDDYIF